jgi:hypothetical protein
MTALDSRYDALAWGSHLTPLLACVCASKGPVLEIGIGHFSTPLLHAVCENLGRRLVSVEDNKEWFEPFAKYNKGNHVVVLQDYDSIAEEEWGVVFIDNSPGGIRRKTDFMRHIRISDYVVVHDYELENKDAIQPVLDAWNINHMVYSEYRPPTLVATRLLDLPLICP